MPDHMTINALANQKGGVGKTSVCLNVAAAAAAKRRVLVIDLDPQATLSEAVGMQIEEDDNDTVTIAHVLGTPKKHTLADAIRSIPGWRFDLALGTNELADMENGWKLGDEWKLHDKLQEVDAYDLVFIDCPPSLGIVTMNALFAATHLYVVTDPRWAALRGAKRMRNSLEIARRGGARFTVAGKVANFVDATNDCLTGLEELRGDESLGPLLEPTVPKGVIISEAQGAGVPLRDLGRHNRADVFADLFDDLARQM